MPKQIEYSIRFPDYGVPYSQIGYNTYAQKILYYAKFMNKPVSLAEYRVFINKKLSTETWLHATRRLISLGFVTQDDAGQLMITDSGKKAVRSIGSRNALNPKRKKD